MNIVPKEWGSERVICNNDMYCGKMMHLNKGFQCSLHYHMNKHETFYVLDGKIIMEINDDVVRMEAGDSIEIPPQTQHRFRGLENTRIIEFSTHHEDSDSYRVELSGQVDYNDDITKILADEGIETDMNSLTHDF